MVFKYLKSFKGTSSFVTLSTNGEDHFAEFHFNAFRFSSATTNTIYVHCEGRNYADRRSFIDKDGWTFNNWEWWITINNYFSPLLLQRWMLLVNMPTNKITSISISTKNPVFAWYHRKFDLSERIFLALAW